MDPLRTCVACRQRAVRTDLLRVVLRDHRLVVDDHANLPGRGAWVHPTTECLNHAVTRKAFARALRASGEIDAGPLREQARKTHG